METIKDNKERNLLDECQKELDSILKVLNANEMFGIVEGFKFQIVDCIHWIIQYLKKNEKENRMEELGAKSITDFIESRNKKTEDKQLQIILQAIIDLKKEKGCVDLINITEYLSEKNLLNDAGGISKICEFADNNLDYLPELYEYEATLTRIEEYIQDRKIYFNHYNTNTDHQIYKEYERLGRYINLQKTLSTNCIKELLDENNRNKQLITDLKSWLRENIPYQIDTMCSKKKKAIRGAMIKTLNFIQEKEYAKQ